MKTAISLPDQLYTLPDQLYRDAERYAKQTRKSRSQLYAEALAEYLARHAPDEVTEDMNAVFEQLGDSCSDPFIARAARRVMKAVEW